MATLGLQRNLVTYFTTNMHISNPKSANMVSNFVGTLYLTPFIGGFAADAYLGRFWAIAVFAVIQLVVSDLIRNSFSWSAWWDTLELLTPLLCPQGMIFLTLSATVQWLRPPPCPLGSTLSCPTAHGLQIGVLYLGLYLIALGNGGIKPNVSTLGADQFDEGDPNERKHMSHFFNWFYFIISIGSLFSVTLFVYIQVCLLLIASTFTSVGLKYLELQCF